MSIALLCSIASAQKKAYLPYFELINVHQDYQYAAVRLFKDYVEEEGKFQVVLPANPDSQSGPLVESSVQTEANALGAEYFIIGSLNRLGEHVIFTMSLYLTEDASLVWKDKQKVNNPEDLDLVLQKLAKALGTDQKGKNATDIYTVTQMEQRKLRQMRVINSFGVSLGSTAYLNPDYFDDPFSAGGGVFWFYDSRTLLFEVDGQVYFTGKSSLAFGSIGIYKPLLPYNQTPFLGGGLGLSNTIAHKDGSRLGGNGLIAYLGGGYILNRLANVGIRIHGRYFVGAYSLRDSDTSIPHGILLNLEIYFAK